MKKGKKSIKALLKLRNKTLPTYVTVLQLVRALNNEISDRQLRRMVSEGKITAYKLEKDTKLYLNTTEILAYAEEQKWNS